MKTGLRIGTLILWGFVATPLAAQQDTCDAINSVAQLAGNYVITNGPGQVINVPGTGTVAGPATATAPAELVQYDNRLQLVSSVFGTMDVSFEMVNNPDEMWNFGQSDVFSSSSSEDISVVDGCANSERLMRLFGHGTTDLPDVGVRPVQVQLIAFPSGILIGRMDVVMLDPNVTLQTRLELKPN